MILLFILLIVRGYYIAMHARDRFGALLAAGISTHFALQTFLNIGDVYKRQVYVLAAYQDIDPGTEVDRGTTITVEFSSTGASD